MSSSGIDPRGPRFGAALTAAILLVIILLDADTANGLRIALAALVVASFALGTARGVGGTWQGAIYRTLVAPRLAPPKEREDPAPPRFAQLVGLIIVGAGLVLELLGVPHALLVATIAAFVAAFLNAAIGFCLGCELYLLGLRLRRRTA